MRGSPWLIAALCALHRLLAPRHPPCAPSSLVSVRPAKSLLCSVFSCEGARPSDAPDHKDRRGHPAKCQHTTIARSRARVNAPGLPRRSLRRGWAMAPAGLRVAAPARLPVRTRSALQWLEGSAGAGVRSPRGAHRGEICRRIGPGSGREKWYGGVPRGATRRRTARALSGPRRGPAPVVGLAAGARADLLPR